MAEPRKTLDFMIKNANKERDAVGGFQPISIELHGDGPMAVDEIRATFGSKCEHSLRSVGIAASASFAIDAKLGAPSPGTYRQPQLSLRQNRHPRDSSSRHRRRREQA